MPPTRGSPHNEQLPADTAHQCAGAARPGRRNKRNPAKQPAAPGSARDSHSRSRARCSRCRHGYRQLSGGGEPQQRRTPEHRSPGRQRPYRRKHPADQPGPDDQQALDVLIHSSAPGNSRYEPLALPSPPLPGVAGTAKAKDSPRCASQDKTAWRGGTPTLRPRTAAFPVAGPVRTNNSPGWASHDVQCWVGTAST